jgi:hypothetical protein
MPTHKTMDFSKLDGVLLDGLDFCRQVYDLFDQVSNEPDGVAKLRLRSTINEKRLVEELIPIARYVQARYREGRRIKVRWFSGSQPYDAILWSSGWLVKQRMAPRKVLLEVTLSVHQNDHLRRRLLHEGGVSFGVKGISRNKTTRQIVSEPRVSTPAELAVDLADQIIERLQSKSGKPYPPGTVLIVNCVANSLLTLSEWNEAMERVKTHAQIAFREAFLIETVTSYSTTLYGERKRRRATK